ncbi:MAG TPA: FAD-dependent thymidylate synthase [Allocoleopsis sp.]
MIISDPFFRVEIDKDATSPNPEAAIWNAQHICVAECDAGKDEPPKEPGKAIVKHQLEGGRGHYSVTAFAFAKINCYGFPHDCIVQLRTHHTSGSDVRFLVQSSRYTSQRFIDVAEGKLKAEHVFYWRPEARYPARDGIYESSYTAKCIYLGQCLESCKTYAHLIDRGIPPEQARNVLPQGIRQDFTIASTLKGFWHLLDQRTKKDAQLEIQTLAEMIQKELEDWCPTLSKWYRENRMNRPATLAP